MFGDLTKHDSSPVTNENIQEIVKLTQYYGFHTDTVEDLRTGTWKHKKPEWEIEYMRNLAAQ